MKREEKARAMEWADRNLNRAKDEIYEASEILRERGMNTDAEMLMKVIYKLEAFQNKYE